MNIEATIHIYDGRRGSHHGDVELAVASLIETIHTLCDKVEIIMATLDDIVSKVTALSTVEDSVIALLTDIKAKLDAAIASGADPVKLQALSDAIDAQKVKLGDAVVANTPAA